MSRKPLIGLAFSVVVLLLLGGLYTNCQPIADGLGESSYTDNASTGSDELPEDQESLTTAQSLWVNSVEPLLRNRCNQCHDLPFEVMQRGGTFGGLNIYNYTFMKNLASAGPTSSDNPLSNKVKGIVTHTGGNMCPGDINGSVSPCREISEWVLSEYPLLTDGKAGIITRTDLEGRVTGWVADPANLNVPVQAVFYLNGPVGIGVLAGSQLANLAGPGATNGLYFNFQFPVEYRDGVERDLYVYADTAVADNLIPSMPVRHQGFVPKPVGDPARNIYENDLRPRLNQCMACHNVAYDVHWFQVGNPTPLGGGTPTNNELIDYMNGQNGHSGGSYCGGNKANEPCASVQRWWAAEFGP